VRPKRHKYKFQLANPEDKFRKDLISIFRHPEPGLKYTIGLDAATGFGADYTSIQVWSNRIPFEQVAWLWNKRTTTVIGSEVMVALARYYNNAFIVPETRYPGNAYVDNAIEKYGYGRIYQKRQTLDENPSESSKYGICTTETDKHLLVNNFKELTEGVDGPQIIFHDENTIYEFCNYVYLEDKDKMGGGEGFHDGTVMGALLALYGCSLHPQAPKPKIEKYDAENEDAAHMRYLQQKHRESLFGKKEEGILVL
jgi:hypothetical protein